MRAQGLVDLEMQALRSPEHAGPSVCLSLAQEFSEGAT